MLAALVARALAVTGLAIAAAGPLTEAAGLALRSNPVYVHPGAETAISAEAASDLRGRVEDLSTPVFIAVLPRAAVEEVGGDPSDLPEALHEATGLRGTYAVVAGNSFRADSNALPAGAAEDAATQAARSGNNAAEVLVSFVERLEGAAGTSGGSSGSGEGGSQAEEEEAGGGLVPLLVIGAIVVGGIVLLTRSSRKRQAVDRQALQAAQQDLQAELAVLADDVLRLEPEVTTVPAAQQDYDAALSRYRWLEAAIPSIDSPDDPPRIQRAMSEAKYAMARAQAIVRGQEPPPPPAELSTPGRYGEPAVEIDEDDEYHRPRYAGQRGRGRGYDEDDRGGWYGGGFFGGNGMFTGLLLGSMLGGGGLGGWGGHSHGGDGGDSGGDHDGGFGGFGGFGDSGGGDFGGGFGDAGGGDFGD